MRVLGSILVVAAWLGIALAAATMTGKPSPQQVAEAPAPEDDGPAEPRDRAPPPEEDLAAREREAVVEAPSEPAAPEAPAEAAVESVTAEPEPAEDEAALAAAERAAPESAPAARDETAEAAAPEAEAEDRSIHVLSEADVERYREIFRAQGRGRWKTADALIAKLEDKRLLGHVLAQRYLHPRYKSRYTQLRRWLVSYADHPVADKVYKLALKKRPAGGILPKQPLAKRGTLAKLGPITSPPYRSTKRLNKAQRRRVRQLERRIRSQVGRRQLTASERLIAGSEVQRLFDDVQIDRATANVAAGWLYFGNYDKAHRLAGGAAQRSGQKAPLALWTTGLASWRLQDFAGAAANFEAYALSPEVRDWYAAAGAYWAARSHQQLGNRDKMEEMLRLAAAHPRSFYGLIARHRLGLSPGFHFRPRPLDGRRAAPLLDRPEGTRALALLQLGDQRRLEKELMALEGWETPEMAEAILAIAEQAQLPSLSLRLAKRLVDGGYDGWSEVALDRALYPVPPWRPKNGFKIDRALVYAVMRQESHFKRFARSRTGARGLMQLLPSTASALIKGRSFRGSKRSQLYDPELNIELGQRYLARLMRMRSVGKDLFRVATAYNGGPGNLRSWTRRAKAEDPLLFIESLPLRESRMYVEHVLTNLWIYRARLGQPAPSLAAIAADKWPAYEALDGKVFEEVFWGADEDDAEDTEPWWRFW